MHVSFPDDDQLNADFFSAQSVRFSVDLLTDFGQCGGAAQRTNPSFLVWVDESAIYMVDLVDGFSPSLATGLKQAIELLDSAGLPVNDRPLYWRDAHKAWHRVVTDCPGFEFRNQFSLA